MNWIKKDIAAEEVRTLARRHEIDLLSASVLLRRGISEDTGLLFYLEDDLRFVHNPFLFNQMEDAVDRILGARDDEEKVLVFGDRDADGITSTVLMVEALQELGLEVQWKVPEGDSGYGLTVAAVEEFAAGGGTLIITVDCGISNVKEAQTAAALGIDLLIFDHHVAPAELPQALAIVNPRLEGESYPFASLAACGVVAKLVWALRFAQTPLYNQRFCLLHCHTGEDGLVVEVSRMVNLVEKKRLCLVFGPQASSADLEKLVRFLENQEIFVFDEKVQMRHLRTLFGPRAEIGLFDLAPQIRLAFPALGARDFTEVKAKSRLPRYQGDAGDLDILASLFLSSVYKAWPQLGTQYTPVLDLVALGTLADLMPLTDENRILVKLGMESLAQNRREGLRALLMRLKMLGRPLSTTDVSWSITPVINAAGRLGAPAKAVELFLTKDEARRKELAQELENLNLERRQLSAAAWDQVLPQARESLAKLHDRMVLVFDPGIPRGITGVLASRLMASFGVPALVMTSQENKTVGSMRTNRRFETRRFLDSFQDLFTDYGGHDQAAGFNLPQEKTPVFLERLTATLADFPLEAGTDSSLDLDAEVPQDWLKPDLMKLVDTFEPYGEGNRPLIFASRGLKILALDLVGKSGAQHVKMTLDGGPHKWPAIYWNALDKLERREFALGDTVDAAFQLGRNFYQGQESLQLSILDLVRSGDKHP